MSLDGSDVGKDELTEEVDRSQSSDIGGPAGTFSGSAQIESGYTTFYESYGKRKANLTRASDALSKSYPIEYT
ncbi:hypothetical protein E4U30_001742 [Claviceps sp. LM220 group G6]|nr:hypothetical protein E4U30_001742 [Claviceps sp. LM220 group G6]